MDSSSFDYCIVGAGPSGLTAAYQLLKAGQSVALIERDDRVGGLAKSHHVEGNIFDTGPHQFRTDDPIVIKFIDSVTQDYYTRTQSSKVYFEGRYYQWPLQFQDLVKLPLKFSSGCLLDLLSRKTLTDRTSFHQFIKSQYGETIYRNFLKDYTEKFLRWDPEDVHADWALTGGNLNGHRSQTLGETIQRIFSKNKQPTYLYPVTGGFGQFYEQLLILCQNFSNFHLILSDEFQQLINQGSSLKGQTQRGQSLDFKELIWTGNLNALNRLIDNNHTQLNYLNTIFYNIICREQGIPAHRAQWIYVYQKDCLISRITCAKEFASSTCREGYYNITCELTDSQRKPHYMLEPQRYIAPILEELLKIGFIIDRKYVENIHIVPVKDTYPIYHRRYLKDFGSCLSGVKNFSDHVHLIGRSGAFWYNNSNHSIRFAIEKVDQLLKKKKEEFNYRKYFGSGAQN